LYAVCNSSEELGGFYETQQTPIRIQSNAKIDPDSESMLTCFCRNRFTSFVLQRRAHRH